MQLIRKIQIGFLLVILGLLSFTFATPVEAACGGSCSVGTCVRCIGKGKYRICPTYYCASCSGSCQIVFCGPGEYQCNRPSGCCAIGPVATPKPDPVDPPAPTPPPCTAVAPATPTLSTPSNGASLSSTSVSLLWNSVLSWGTACSGASNQYKVYVGTTNPPTTLYKTVSSNTYSTNYTGSRGTTYYWGVQALNGSAGSGMNVHSFTILDDQIQGHVFYDVSNSCSHSTPWSTGGVSISLDSGAGNPVSGDGSYLLTAATTSTHTLDVSLPAGFSCSTTSGCNQCSRSWIVSPSANNNFYLTDLLEPWWQAAGLILGTV